LPGQGAPGRAGEAPGCLARRTVRARDAPGRGRCRRPAAGPPSGRGLSPEDAMSIERTNTSSAAEAARAREGTSEARERPPVNREQTARFRNALDQAGQGVQQGPQRLGEARPEGAAEGGGGAELRQTATADAVQRADEGGRGDGGSQGQDGADV